MGGLAFDDSENSERIFPIGIDRLTLNPQFIIWCLERGYKDTIPRIAESEIRDKSKANSVVKALACIQALWFCLQFITRLAQKLPVSLLELNTFAHCICALLIYILWWEKPLDVDEPIVIPTTQTVEVSSLAAWAAFHSNLDIYERSWGVEKWKEDSIFRTKPKHDSLEHHHYRLRQPSLQRLPSPRKFSTLESRPFFPGLNEDAGYEYICCNPPVL